MAALGAELELVPSDGGKVTPALFDCFRARIAVLTKDPNTYWTDQFHNEDAFAATWTSVTSWCEQTGGRLTRSAVRSAPAGMLRGVSRALKEAGSHARIVALEPSTSPALTEDGRRAPRRGDRHRGMVAAPGRSAATTRRVRSMKTTPGRWHAAPREEGVFVGTSTGLNLVGGVAARP